jgi:hypothetical protein
VGVCASKTGPVAAFPAHWGPNGMARYDKKQFPARYRDGVFIAFHGSWDRAPYPQSGYNVVFQPLAGTRASGGCEVFADGFAGAVKTPEGAAHRPSGVAVGPDGALYVSDDIRGRIYRIVYRAAPPATRGAPLVRVPRLRPAISSRLRQTRPKERMQTRVRLRASPFPMERRETWLRLEIVFTTGKWAERLARVATARTVRVHL